MRTKGVNKEQQLKYILECRNSGLTDYMWRQENGIYQGKFYNECSIVGLYIVIQPLLF